MSLPQTMELFQPDEALVPTAPARESLAPGAMLLRGLAETDAVALLADLRAVLVQAPLRHMVTPGGFRMSVAMSNCGALGWVSDPTGYRYDAVDPDSGRHWPAMPASFLRLARLAAAEVGFSGFEPDACLVNRYEPGARLTQAPAGKMPMRRPATWSTSRQARPRRSGARGDRLRSAPWPRFRAPSGTAVPAP